MEKFDPNKGDSGSLIDQVKDATLKYSGLSYLIGDAALFAYGMSKREYGSALTGLGWGAGGLALAIYGKQSPEYQLKRVSEDLGRYLIAKGIQLPPESDLNRTTLKSYGVLPGLERFMYDHPSEVLNGVYALFSTGLLYSGLKKNDHWQAASGAFVSAGALSGLLIPEKEKQPGDEPISLLSDPVGWVQEKPLRLSGLLYSVNNVTLAKSGFDEMRANPSNKSYLYKYLTVASYVVANTLLALSHKDRENEESKLPMEELEKAAAEVIAAQSPDVQDALLRDVAEYLSQRKNIIQNATELAEALKTQVAALTKGQPVQQAQHEGTIEQTELARS